MTTELSIVNAGERGLKLASLDDMLRFAELAVNSGMTPKDMRTPASAFMAMQHGMELGLSPAASLQSIAVINGRPCVWGDAALALVTSHPDCEDIKEWMEGEKEDRVAWCTVKRKGRSEVTRSFSRKEATHAGLTDKPGPWKQYPVRMLQMRARAFALRDSFPDALKGVGIREEVQDYQRNVTPDRKPIQVTLAEDEAPSSLPTTNQLALEPQTEGDWE
jgi:hypothetical protein